MRYNFSSKIVQAEADKDIIFNRLFEALGLSNDSLEVEILIQNQRLRKVDAFHLDFYYKSLDRLASVSIYFHYEKEVEIQFSIKSVSSVHYEKSDFEVLIFVLFKLAELYNGDKYKEICAI